MVGASASTVEVAEGWEKGSGSDGDGETSSVIMKGTCSLDPGVRVVSIEEDSVGRAEAFSSSLGSRTFLLHFAVEARLVACGIFASLPRIGPASAQPFFVFAGIGPLQAAFPEISETRSSDFSSLIEVRRDRLFAVRLSCLSSLESDRLLRVLPPQKGMCRSAMSPIADEAKSIIPGRC